MTDNYDDAYTKYKEAEKMREWSKKRAHDMMNAVQQYKYPTELKEYSVFGSKHQPDTKVMHDTQDKTAALIGYIMVALVSGGFGVLFGMAV